MTAIVFYNIGGVKWNESYPSYSVAVKTAEQMIDDCPPGMKGDARLFTDEHIDECIVGRISRE